MHRMVSEKLQQKRKGKSRIQQQPLQRQPTPMFSFQFSLFLSGTKQNPSTNKENKSTSTPTKQELELTFLDLMRGKMTCEEKHGVQREGTERNSHVASYHPSQTNQKKLTSTLFDTPKKTITTPRKFKPENWFTLILTKGFERNPQTKQTSDSTLLNKK